ncbi:MAG: peptide ABC transporter substrate-binding protein [Anaerolineae bacterium]|nr:peptide ABC transporter substrate-binding protein [Anaerolineae bacterium]
MAKMRNIVCLFMILTVALAMIPASVSAQEKSITISFDQEADSLNPMYSTMTFAGFVRQLVLRGPWDYDGVLNPHAVLVTEIPSLDNGGISADGTTITLTLRDDIVWSDGEPITSADFVFTYDMYMSDANAPISRDPYDKIESIEAPDAATVVIKFPEPYAPWLGLFLKGILPKHVLQPVFDADGTLDAAEWNRNPTVSNGPFVLETWETGNFLRFVRNENYFDGLAKLDSVIVTVVPDSEAYVAGLVNGDADLGYFFPFDSIPEIEAGGHGTVSVIAGGYNEAWQFNVREGLGHPALQDVNVRRALVMAFDRWQICDDLLLGYTYPPSSFWEEMPYDNPDVEPYPYDPEAAVALLDEAGWVDTNGDGTRDKDGVELVLRYATNTRQLRQDIQVVVQQAFAEIGVGIEIINHPSDIFWNSYADGGPLAIGDYDIDEHSSSPDAWPEPDTRSFTCAEIPSEENLAGSNWTGACDEELDALFEEQSRTMDFATRVEIYHKIVAKMHDLAIWNGLWFDADTWFTSNRLQGPALNGNTPFWNINEWDVSE